MLGKILDITMKILIALTFGLAILSLFRPDLIKDLIEQIQILVDKMGNWNYLIVFVSSLIESFPVLWVVVPGQNILLIVGWFFAEQSQTKLIYVCIISSIWAICWNWVWYLLGRYYGEWFFKKYWLWFGIGETEVKYLKQWIQKWGPLGVILGKFHSLARAFIPFIAGSMGMKKTSFFIYNVIGSIIRSISIVVLWVLFAKTYETFIDYIGYIFLAIMLLTWVYMWFFKREALLRYIDEKNKEIESKYK